MMKAATEIHSAVAEIVRIQIRPILLVADFIVAVGVVVVVRQSLVHSARRGRFFVVSFV